MRRTTFIPLILFFCITFSPDAAAQTVVDTTLAMSDGIVLDALYVLPNSAPPASGYPAVLLVHGFGGNKNGGRSTALAFARSGYASTAYSVRGQGASGGEFDFFTSERIRADLQSMIDFTKALPRVNPERIGVQGGSQGGIHAWMAAAYDMKVRAVASFVANGRFHQNWLESNALNWTFAMTIRTTDVRIRQELRDSLISAMDDGDYSYMNQLLQAHSTRSMERSVTTPTAIYVSYHDGFFNPTAALEQFNNIPARKSIVLYPGGHSFPPDKETSDFVIELNRQWWEYWLKDNQDYAHIATPDSAVVFFDGATSEPYFFSAEDAMYWTAGPTPPELTPVNLFFSHTGIEIDEEPAAMATLLFNFIPGLGSTPFVLRTQPLDHDMTLSARPAETYFMVESASGRFQYNLHLYDVDPASGKRLPITRGHYEQTVTNNGVYALPILLNSVMHTVKAGHQIEAVIHAGSALIPDFSKNFGNFVVPPPFIASSNFHMGGDYPSRCTFWKYESSVTGVLASIKPAAFDLGQNYPNPCNPSTTIAYNLERAGYANLSVFDLFGNQVSVLISGEQSAGGHRIVWNTSGIPSGTYFYRLRSNDRSLTRKLIILK